MNVTLWAHARISVSKSPHKVAKTSTSDIKRGSTRTNSRSSRKIETDHGHKPKHAEEISRTTEAI